MSRYQILLIFLVAFALVNNFDLFAQSDETEYEQITIRLNVDKLGIYEMDAIYSEENVYIPIIDLFRKLEIFLHHSPELDTITGFILSKENAFSINQYNNQISFRDKTKILKKNELISDFSDIYLPTYIYKELFGFTMQFNFRELMLSLKSDIELPIIKQLRIKNMRANLNAISGEIAADTAVNRKWHWFRGLVYDWQISSTQNNSGSYLHQLRSAVGVEILGGELNWKSTLLYDSSLKFQNTDIRWKYINDRIPVVKQIELGNVNANLSGQTISNFYGLKITNTPYSFRKTFGKYFIQRKTNPNWEVELYLNGVLVNFTTADLDGNFSFEIPIVYGNSTLLLRYYGPWGQENSEEIILNIPFSFTAKNRLEYISTTGVTKDSLRNICNKTKISYGLSRWATIGVGYEFFSGNLINKNVFSGTLNIALGNRTLLNYTYLHNSNHYTELLFRSKKNFVINAKHRQFYKNQVLIQTTNKAESELDINFPLWNKKLKVTFRNSNRVILGKYTTTFISESALSVFYKRVNTVFSVMTSRETIFNLITSIYLKNNWIVVHKSSYNCSTKQVVNSTLQLQKRFNQSFYTETNLSYNYNNKSFQVGVSLFLDFNFLRSSITASMNKKSFSSTQSLMGSVHLSTGVKKVFATNSSNVGKSGIDILVFLDINHNNRKDENEPLVKNASVAINKGKQVMAENDSVHRFVGLEPYTNYLITIANNGFPYISWILEKSTWSITTSPNQINKVYVPVKPMGEIEMNITLNKSGKLIPASRLIVYILDNNNAQVAKIITERDGSFTYLGLAPGSYSIRFDEKQLKGLGLSANYEPLKFIVNASEQGDYLDGLKFQLEEVK